MSAIASQITSLTIVYSTVYSDADQGEHQSSASLAFVWGIHRGPVNSPHKWPVTRKMFPFDDVIMSFQTQKAKNNAYPKHYSGCREHCIERGGSSTYQIRKSCLLCNQGHPARGFARRMGCHCEVLTQLCGCPSIEDLRQNPKCFKMRYSEVVNTWKLLLLLEFFGCTTTRIETLGLLLLTPINFNPVMNK